MGIVVAYSLLALFFLALSIGLYKPKRWNDLTEKNVRFLKFGCFFGFLVITFNVASNFL
jgi:tellurite resistance protein TehA-like permease